MIDDATATELFDAPPPTWRVSDGLVDLQVNGAAGHEIGADRSANATIARALPRSGVTAFLPTLVSRPLGEYEACAASLDETVWPEDGARALGVHLEGPFLAPARHGAHDPAALLNPTRQNVDALVRSAAPRAITLAPELPGALDAISRLSADGVAVFIGHTDADAELARTAIDAGAVMLTHAMNAMRGVETRTASALMAFLGHPRAHASVIADGVHVHPEALTLLCRLLEHRLVLVSDASSPAGAPPGRYRLGPHAVDFDGEKVTVGGGLAGSGRLLDTGVRTLVAGGWPVEAALRAASSAPRAVLGIESSNGEALWDEELNPRAVRIDAQVVYADLPGQAAGPGSP